MVEAYQNELLKPPQSATGITDWLKKNLFSTWYNALLTIFILLLLILFLRGIVSWVLFSADWSPITNNLKLYAVGQYPSDQLWRIGVNITILSILIGASWGLWGNIARTIGIWLAAGFTILAALPVGLEHLGLTGRIWMISYPIAIILGLLAVKLMPVRKRWVVYAWLMFPLIALTLLFGIERVPFFPHVETRLWGGLLLTFVLALAGITASFPLGVLLALGRRSDLKVLKLFCVAFIEVIRGVPLITLLFMSQVVFPLFLPESFAVDRIVGALFVITIFSAAYTAENVRGGLQAIPPGQIEAAQALGLSSARTTIFIILPQALRSVIPAIVGQFISLFKDTSLVAIVGLLDILGIGKSIVLGNVEWVDAQREVFIFIGLVYWIFTYTMSYASRKLEIALGVGSR